MICRSTSGVPTLRLKLIATTLSGALMGMAGAPLPYYVTYLDPQKSGPPKVQDLIKGDIVFVGQPEPKEPGEAGQPSKR